MYKIFVCDPCVLQPWRDTFPCFPQSASQTEVKVAVAYIRHVDIPLHSPALPVYLRGKTLHRMAKAVHSTIRRSDVWCGAAEYGVVSGSFQITKTKICGTNL